MVLWTDGLSAEGEASWYARGWLTRRGGQGQSTSMHRLLYILNVSRWFCGEFCTLADAFYPLEVCFRVIGLGPAVPCRHHGRPDCATRWPGLSFVL